MSRHALAGPLCCTAQMGGCPAAAAEAQEAACAAAGAMADAVLGSHETMPLITCSAWPVLPDKHAVKKCMLLGEHGASKRVSKDCGSKRVRAMQHAPSLQFDASCALQYPACQVCIMAQHGLRREHVLVESKSLPAACMCPEGPWKLGPRPGGGPGMGSMCPSCTRLL